METEILSIPAFPFCKLWGSSFVLDVTTDQLLITITKSVPLLVELDLEDRPKKEPVPNHHLTNNWLQYLGFCQYLTALSLVRSRLKHQGAFKRVNDMGMFLLSEGCKCLEAVTLCGFSNVSDAGFAAILHVCQKLNKFEVRNALFLSDVAFHDLMDIPCALVEVRLLSCPRITSETVKKVASSKSMEVLDLGGCKSIADSCLCSISCLSKLTELNLTGADITDSGLPVLSQGSIPIRNLCLRGCKRVTDKGISSLLCGGAIGQTLTALDLGYMAGVTDKTILTVAAACVGIIDLCIRSCFYVTDSSMEVLARKRTFQDGSERLRRLDECNCICLSADSLRWFKRLSL